MLISNTILVVRNSSPKYLTKGIFILDKILCLKIFEGADVKYHSKEVFLSSSPKIPKQDKFGPKFKKI